MKQIEEGLQREVGVLGLSANIVNIIVGAGIFVIPAIIAEQMGAASILAYLVCGLLIALIMLCFAEAGSKVTSTGGGFAYVEAAFGKFPGFLVANLGLAGSLLADAAVANALVDILGASFSIFKDQIIRVLFFGIVFFGLAGINAIGVKKGIGLVKAITLIKLSPLLLLILIGFKDVSVANLFWEQAPSFSELGATCLMLIFAFQGCEVGIIMGGEIKNPKKTVPRAIFIAILTVLSIYVLLQTVAQGVLGNQLVSFKEAPLAETAQVVFGPPGYTLLFIGAAVSMFGYLTGAVLNNPRMLFALSRDKVIPVRYFANIHKRFKTPYISIFFYAGVGFTIASLGGFKVLINIASAAMLLVYLGVVLSVIQLRRKYKRDPNEFEVPGGITIPILSTVIICYILAQLSSSQKIGVVIFIALLTILSVSYRFYRLF